MSEQYIACPHCHKQIPLTQAITQQIEEKLRIQIEDEKAKEYQQKLAEIRTKLQKEVTRKAYESVSVEMKDLKEELQEKTKLLDETKKQELVLRKKQRELEEKARNVDLEVARRLDKERQKLVNEAQVKILEEHRLKDREKDKQLADLKKQHEELQRKFEQGSQQMQGEVQELELEDILMDNFPMDEVEPVAKGVKGGDILQKVHNDSGRLCGTILWESKRTKNWGDGWIQKLKDDVREAKADVGVILSTILPKDFNKHFGHIDGVWVTDLLSVVGLATALRLNLEQVSQARNALVGKGQKMELLYNYLSGPEFRQRIEAIAESFISMKSDLETEKRLMEKQWAKREKLIERIVGNTAGMYGDLEGIIGASLPQLKMFQLPPAESTDEDLPF